MMRFGTVSRSYFSTQAIKSFAIPNTQPKRKNLIGITYEELQSELASIPGIKTYTAAQIWSFMYKQGYSDFDSMSSIPKNLIAKLKDQFVIDYGEIKLDKLSIDGTRKFLVGYDTKTYPSHVIESVIIPEPKRSTLCLSSQIGCSLACTFCHTGTQKLQRSLTASEVVGQYMIAAHSQNDFPLVSSQLERKRSLTNLVFMGQGEPLYNWRNTSKAVSILINSSGLAVPKPKITISTSGVAPLIPKVASELGVSLAISLHATRNSTRDKIVPLNKTYPISEVLDACKQYVRLLGKRRHRITFEYVMLRGVNDSLAEAHELVKLLKEIPAHVNLIPWNPWPGSIYETSTSDQIDRFASLVMEGNVPCTVRRPRGQDIMAACGQLKSSHDSKRRSGDSGRLPSAAA
ncbi:23S rRNA m(2)A-2503 methyltransferase [Umbelopsis sp. PMI_123]|nr:23S rRNA m(2)A-2503 methyltransferase [Umbelopsis sp. PMI_123]